MLVRSMPDEGGASVGLRSNLKFVGQYLTGIGVTECEHVKEIADVSPTVRECMRCKEEGTRPVHLRMCMTCGFVGCCDSSEMPHMRAHALETGHPIARSIEGDESWLWCFPHERLVRRRL